MSTMILDTIKGQRKTVGRTCKKILGLAAEINQAMPELKQDLTVAGLFLNKAEERLLSAETKIEDAKKHFAKLGRTGT
jgi:hypothetical protein